LRRAAPFQTAVPAQQFLAHPDQASAATHFAALGGFNHRLGKAAIHAVEQVPGPLVAHLHCAPCGSDRSALARDLVAILSSG